MNISRYTMLMVCPVWVATAQVSPLGIPYRTAASGVTPGSVCMFPSTAQPAILAFATEPANGAIGTALTPAAAVLVEDANGNIVTGSSTAVTLTSAPAGLQVTVNAVSGMATFSNLIFGTAGTYTLTASSLGLAGATSNAFSISAGGASRLVFTTQPTSGIAGTALSTVVVQVQSLLGNPVNPPPTPVTLTSSPAGINATVTTVNGNATFNGLVLNTAGTYTLTASSSGISSVTSSSFTITRATTIALNSSANPSISGQNITLTATVSPAAATGSVTFKDGSSTLGSTTLNNGTSTLTLSTLTSGAHALTAVYSGDSLDAGSTSPTLTQTVNQTSYMLSGTITVSGVGLSGVTVTLSGSATGSTITTSSGTYIFGILAAGGSYTVTPSLTGYSFTPPSQTFSNLSSNPAANFTATGGVTISGQVTASGVGLSGVAININGSQTLSTLTNASGNYSLSLAGNGTYTLSPALAGYSFTPPVSFFNLTSNQTVNFAGVAVAGLDFYPVTPCRIADTRTGAGFTGQFGPPSMSGGQTRTFTILASPCASGIPATVAAYSLNFTVVPPAGGPPANLTTWPASQPAMPNVSTLNFSSATVANAAIVPAGSSGAISVYVNDPANVLFDINGYFAPPLSAGLEFYAMTPCRVADTRTAAGFPSPFGPPSMTAGQTRTFTLPSSSCGIPATASAYSLNFTAVPPSTGPPANLTTWPATQPTMPNVSTLNFSGSVVANAALVPAGTNDAINVFVNYPADMLFDINGYFAPPLPSGLHFYPVAPCRVADTRTAAGFTGQFGPPSMTAGQTRMFTIPSSSCEIPATAAAYSLNFTVVPPAGGAQANMTTWPAGMTTMPNVSTLNFSGGTLANAAIVPAGANGAINVYVDFPTDLLFDINGYFAP